MTRDSVKSHEEKSATESARTRLPNWNELPEYGIEALISTIDNQRDLIAAIRREARWNKGLKDS